MEGGRNNIYVPSISYVILSHLVPTSAHKEYLIYFLRLIKVNSSVWLTQSWI